MPLLVFTQFSTFPYHIHNWCSLPHAIIIQDNNIIVGRATYLLKLCVATVSYSVITFVLCRELNVLKSQYPDPRTSLKACWRNKCIKVCVHLFLRNWQHSTKVKTWLIGYNNGITMWTKIMSDKYWTCWSQWVPTNSTEHIISLLIFGSILQGYTPNVHGELQSSF